MKRHTLYSLPAVLLISLLTHFCASNPVEPEADPTPGRRDYVWSLDTLDMPMNYISEVWGASPNDVWAVGAMGTHKDRLLHYDGEKWETYTNEFIWTAANALFGFSADNVWMGGSGGWLEEGAGIWHYDGTKWSQNYVYEFAGSRSIYVQDLWGTAPNDLYASGVISFYDGQTDDFRGFVLHYNGRQWKEVIKVGPLNSQFTRVRKEKNNLYMRSFRNGLISGVRDEKVIYKVEGNQAMELYATTSAANIQVIAGKVYFIFDNAVHIYSGSTFIKQFSFDELNTKLWGVHGRTAIDFFVGTKDGIAHYNGEDTKFIYRYPAERIGYMNEPAILDKEVFFSIRNHSGDISALNQVLIGRIK